MKIGGLDYSRPEFKTMFANYGLTAIAAVSLEKSIILLIAAIDNLCVKGDVVEIFHFTFGWCFDRRGACLVKPD
jgi:hypothetical protein